jgi:Domain of unknown function (DUF5658)
MAHAQCERRHTDKTGPRWGRLDTGMRANRLLLVLFVELQFADILSTNSALAVPGVWEANPLMALAQGKLGAAWWLPKAAAAALCCFAAPLSGRSWPLIAATGYYAAIVCGNLAQL